MLRLIAVVLVIGSPAVVAASPQYFVLDFEGFRQAAGSLNEIDFETLPDGTPSRSSTDITPTYNYDAQGVRFTSPLPRLFIAGSVLGGFSLRAETPFPGFDRNWIDAALTVDTYSAGVFSGGHTQMCAYAEGGALIGCVAFDAPGSDRFIGIVSDVRIDAIRVDRGSTGEFISSFVFAPVPEPVSAGLFLLGLGIQLSRRKRLE